MEGACRGVVMDLTVGHGFDREGREEKTEDIKG